MIESDIIEWIDYNDSIQNIDVYSKKFLIKLFGLLRYLLQNNNFPLAINIFFLIIYFLQICTMSIEFISSEEDTGTTLRRVHDMSRRCRAGRLW